MTDPRPDPPPLPRATDKRGCYPGSGDGATMRPPAPIPSGYIRNDSTHGEQGDPTPYDAGLREGFRRALEGEEPWWPIPGNPTGEYRGSRFNLGQLIHGTVESLGRTLDPVRAAALHEAVRFCRGRSWPTQAALVTDVLVVADRFVAWLVGDADETEQEAP